MDSKLVLTPLKQGTLPLSSLCVVDKGCFEDDLLQLSASRLQCVIVPF